MRRTTENNCIPDLDTFSIPHGLNTKQPQLPLHSEIPTGIQSYLSRPFKITVVQNIDTERLWGCVPKGNADIAAFGSGVYMNEDLFKRLESELDENSYVSRVCKLLLFTVFGHETMHKLRHFLFPQFTPPKMPLLVVNMGLIWLEGDYDTVKTATLLKANRAAVQTYMQLRLLSENRNNTIVLIPNEIIPDPLSPWINGREPPPPTPLAPTSVGLAISVVPPGYAVSYVGDDRYKMDGDVPSP
ncbi:hypothetical protein BDP27DRAFT_1364408 [Rhodocollybia butyracea]|uniref:Uncharacterized protein n=1 Tax=Rhodocollybia butyracea TaxID=206335 RepID=A0A9P5U6R2_9AGAR|nr:hypothetical protein BDP27DRAFT_1364408 [Rhodocollybia butyracea]